MRTVRLIPALGVAWTLLYAAFVVWLYATAPRSFKDVTTRASVAAGTYRVDPARFDAGRELFLREQYAAARDEWSRADPARRPYRRAPSPAGNTNRRRRTACARPAAPGRRATTRRAPRRTARAGEAPGPGRRADGKLRKT